jgi:hypothetical protein
MIKIGYDVEEWINLVQDWDQWRFLVTDLQFNEMRARNSWLAQ